MTKIMASLLLAVLPKINQMNVGATLFLIPPIFTLLSDRE